MSASEGRKDVFIEGNRHFVPWALQTLAGTRVGRGKRGVDLPVGQATSLTAEARDRILEALPVAAVRFLVGEGGWQRVLIPGKSGRVVEGARLSHAEVWEELQLEFSDRSIDALIRTYNLESYPRDARHSDWLTGDAVILHLLRIHEWRNAEGRTHVVNYPYYPPSPLSIVATFVQSRIWGAKLDIVWDLFEPVLPWFSFHLGQHWAENLTEMLRGVAQDLSTRCNWLRDVFQDWQRQVEERDRPDLARPMVLAARSLMDWLDDGPNIMVRMIPLFERLEHPSEHSRQRARDDVASPLKALLGARDIHEECLSTLPFERTAAQKVFVRDCERYGASDVWRRLETCVADLEGVIG